MSGIIKSKITGVLIKRVEFFGDKRGCVAELFRCDQIECESSDPVMGYISYTNPGITRGPHAHTDQSDLFAFIGPGDFQLHIWDSRSLFPLETHEVYIVGESNPTIAVIPQLVVHGYVNVSNVTGMVLNFPDQLYKGIDRKEPVDEIRYEDLPESIYRID